MLQLIYSSSSVLKPNPAILVRLSRKKNNEMITPTFASFVLCIMLSEIPIQNPATVIKMPIIGNHNPAAPIMPRIILAIALNLPFNRLVLFPATISPLS
ncbi:hypothetical protein V6C21_09975 [[Clostridium] cellulosi]